MKKSKKKKVKVVYTGDTGQTIYSMAALEGRTPEEQEEYDRRRKNRVSLTLKERWAMISAAFQVYGPMFLVIIIAFCLAALFMYWFLS